MKYKYIVKGYMPDKIHTYNKECIATDIIEAINMFRDINCSVIEVKMCCHEDADAKIGIISLVKE